MSQSTPSSTPPTPATVLEEERHLARVRKLLIEHPPAVNTQTDQDLVGELKRVQDEFRTAKLEDRGSLMEQINGLTAMIDQQAKKVTVEEIDPANPYFAHLQVEEDDRARSVFIGKATRLDNGLRIVDWRNAPISRLFYQYDEGDDYSEEMGDRVREGTVLARRTLLVSEGELLRVGTRKVDFVKGRDGWRESSRDAQRLAGGEGAALRAGSLAGARLGSGTKLRADKHLPDIAALIDPEQFKLITADDSGVVVLRGSAGSGKTTVALHRIAYLAFESKRFSAKRCIVIVWGRAMRDYVAHVLPALGVEGVEVTTWSEWSRARITELMPDLPLLVADDTPAAVTRLKLHPGVSALLAQHIAKTPGPGTPRQVIEDWAHILTDKVALRAAVAGDMSEAALQRALDWTVSQATGVVNYAEGELGIDARLDVEDDALLLRAWQLRVGKLQTLGKPINYCHMVLDEVQDFSPVEVQVLLGACDKHQSVTMAGDTRQHISQEAGFSSWQEFLARIGVESRALSTLEVSYRSTHPITRFAIDVLDDNDEPPPRTTKDGPAVELFRFGDHGACVAFLSEELRRLLASEPNANIALLTPDPATSEVYFQGLRRADLPDLRLVEDQRFAFAPGIDVVEATQVKGLEFDYVVLIEVSARHYPDTGHHRRLLHVASTRAVHQLWLTCVATPSPILPEAVR